MYEISTAIMIYHEGTANLIPAVSSALDWIEKNSDFIFDRKIYHSSSNPTASPFDGHYFLNPLDVNWREIPEVQFPILLWSCRGSFPCPIPWAGGLTWGFYDWRGDGSTFPVCSIAYTWQLPEKDDSWLWHYHSGFPTLFEAMLVHEWKNALHIWLRERYGFDILNTYPNGAFLDCKLYGSQAECYRAFLNQITPTMYARMGRWIVPPSPEVITPPPPPEVIPRPGLIIPLLGGIVALGLIGGSKNKKKAKA